MQEAVPDFKECCYQRIFKCKRGHIFKEKFRFCKRGKTEIKSKNGRISDNKEKPMNDKKEEQIRTPNWLKEINEFVKSIEKIDRK